MLGHVDGVGRIRGETLSSGSLIFGLEIDPGTVPYVATKGSVTVDGSA